jgi:hypothetical protein
MIWSPQYFTPFNKVILEKLVIRSSPSQEVTSVSFVPLRLTTVFTEARNWFVCWRYKLNLQSPTLRLLRSVLILPSNLLLDLPYDPFSWGLPVKFCMYLSCQTRSTWPAHRILLDIISVTIFCKEYIEIKKFLRFEVLSVVKRFLWDLRFSLWWKGSLGFQVLVVVKRFPGIWGSRCGEEVPWDLRLSLWWRGSLGIEVLAMVKRFPGILGSSCGEEFPGNWGSRFGEEVPWDLRF